MKANSHHLRVNNILTEQSMHEQSPIAKKIWLSIHPRNFGSQMTVRQCNCPSVHTTGILGDPGADSRGEGKSNRVEKYGTKEK